MCACTNLRILFTLIVRGYDGYSNPHQKPFTLIHSTNRSACKMLLHLLMYITNLSRVIDATTVVVITVDVAVVETTRKSNKTPTTQTKYSKSFK